MVWAGSAVVSQGHFFWDISESFSPFSEKLGAEGEHHVALKGLTHLYSQYFEAWALDIKYQLSRASKQETQVLMSDISLLSNLLVPSQRTAYF